jgi:hypothetical protein
MKKYTIALAAVLLMGATAAFAQKTNNNPLYSTGNYKHANKAAEARQRQERENPAPEQVRQGTLSDATGPQSANNYKAQNPRRVATGIVTDAPAVPQQVVKNPSASPRNYKHQSPFVEPQSQLARQKAKEKRENPRTAVGE